MSSIDYSAVAQSVRRIRWWYGVLLLVIIAFGLRLFYVQIIRYDHYHAVALSDQLKQYQVPATRGLIEAYESGATVPIVLNQTLYTLYADPTLVTNPASDADKVAKVIGGSASQYQQDMQISSTRYVVLAKKLTAQQSSQILGYKLPGIGTQAQDYRTYPDGSLASQVLGFVNDDGAGEYGVEQALNTELAGKPGQLKAITDASGVPLVASSNNINIKPVPGNNVVLTLDMGMQAQMEQILSNEAKATKSQLISALIMDPNTGAIKAMANYPTYDPSNYASVTDPSVFNNATVSNPIEVGSIMKTLTTSAALDQGVIQPNTTFYDPAHWVIDGFNVTDIEQDGGPGVRSIADILNLSLNTGATWMLMQMGGGQINQKARDAWYNYMVNRFQLGKPTGIEQGYESPGYVPSPNDNGAGIDLTYANTAFGQAMTVTAVQMGAALSSVLNGGTYYQPHLVSQTIEANGTTITTQPKIVKSGVVAPKVGQELIPLMQYVVQQHLLSGFSYLNFGSNYLVGGKTGTAQIALPGGGYSGTQFNGTYVGFVGGNTKPQYVIVVYAIEPTVPGYAGSYAGQPVFADLAHMLINDGYATPKS
jgi:cell division protein FtsI/penicillin-binding protein 2